MWALEEQQRIIYLPETSCYWFTTSFNCLGDVSQMFFPPFFSLLLSFSPYGKCICTQRHFEREETMEHLCEEWWECWESLQGSAKADSPLRQIAVFKLWDTSLFSLVNKGDLATVRQSEEPPQPGTSASTRNKRSIMIYGIFISMQRFESCICNRMSVKSGGDADCNRFGKNKWPFYCSPSLILLCLMSAVLVLFVKQAF